MEDFYAALPAFEGFSGILEPDHYRPLPDDWLLGLSDVVNSTAAMTSGRYKTVNTAGASVIAAVRNALPSLDLPFVFGGDGASFAMPPGAVEAAGQALAATAAWVRDDLGFELRVALVPVREVREAGHDVRIARFAASPSVSYAMFSGGGLGWAEAEMKAGRRRLPPAVKGTHPDLTGLSCRWGEIPASRGIILSIVVSPTQAGETDAYRRAVTDVLSLLDDAQQAGRPRLERGPLLRWPPDGFDIEARASRRAGEPLWLARLKLALRSLLALGVFATRVELGGFNPDRYLRETVENTDFRKYDDGLRMTIDCTPAVADRLETMLRDAARSGVLRFGLHRQGAALLTCIVQSALRSDHLHFLDGAAGGYAAAASRLKEAASI